MTYEMRSGNEPDVEEALQDAKQHLESDTREEVRARAKSDLELAVEQAKYQVRLNKKFCKLLNRFLIQDKFTVKYWKNKMLCLKLG